MDSLATRIDRAATPRRIAVALYFVTLFFRLWFIWESQVLPDFRTPTPGLDICLHWEGAKHIRAGTPDPVFELMPPSAPFHPYFVAFCQSFLGENVLRHRLFRALMGSFSTVLVFLVGFHITKKRWASALSAFIVMTLPSWIYFDTMMIKVGVELVLLSTALWLLFRDVKQWRTWRFVGLGLLLGILLAIMRFSQGGTVLYVTVIAIYLLIRRDWAARRYRLCVMIPMVVLVLGTQIGFTYRQQLFGIRANHFLPVGGVHMRIGFQHHAIGTYHVLRRFPAFPLGHTFFSRMAAEARLGRILTPREADQSYIDEAKEFIRENPGETVKILFRKAGLFFNNFEPAGNHFLQHIQERVVILDIPTIGYGGLVLLALWGVVALAREGHRSLLFLLVGLWAAVLISNLATFVQWRYRLHCTLPMALLAGPGLIFLLGVLLEPLRCPPEDRKRALRRLAVALLITVAVGWITYRPVLSRGHKSMMKTGNGNMNQSVRGERYAREVAEMDALPGLTVRQREKRAVLLYSLARYTESFKEVEPLATTDPYSAIPASRQYLVYLIWYGDYERVVGYLRWLQENHPRTFWALSGSFSSDSRFWHGADPNLRLIVQSILRDIISPRLGMRTPRRQ
jgi:hypothetical protein